MYTEYIAKNIAAIRENAVDCICESELAAKLEACQSRTGGLRLKIGFDPTASDIHLGHTVLLRKLRKLQNLGHTVCLVIGDFTAKIGDPSGKSALRPVLSDDAIRDNAATYTEQAFKILDRGRAEIYFNSQWYKDKSVADFLSILSCYTMARVLERDDFSMRLKENKPLTILEIMYPLIQGYDSVCLRSDVEFGGTDQKFNLIVGRHLQESFGQKPQAIVTMPLLVGTDGKQKMSKSLANYIAVLESPRNMFGKIMSITDETMREYYRLLIDTGIAGIENLHPKEAKLRLAEAITSQYHGVPAGAREREEFQRVFAQKEIPHDMPVYACMEEKIDVVEALAASGVVASKNEARRLIQQKAVAIMAGDAQEVCGLTAAIRGAEIVLKVGKKKFLKIVKK